MRRGFEVLRAAIGRGASGAVTISVVLHAVAALTLARIMWVVPTPPPSPPRPSVVWFGAWGQAPQAAEQDGDDDTDSEPSHAAPAEPAVPLPRPQANEPTPEAGTAHETQAAEPPAIAEPPGPAIDWAEARRRAIEDVVRQRERAASYRSFSFPGTLEEEQRAEEAENERRIIVGLQPPKTAFDSPSKGRAGLDDQNALGQYVVWVSDDCYRTFGSSNIFILPSAQALYGAPMTTCVPVQARDDLFDNVKPSYLMGVEEHDERAERLRRLDTGAVASFD